VGWKPGEFSSSARAGDSRPAHKQVHMRYAGGNPHTAFLSRLTRGFLEYSALQIEFLPAVLA
jgi:hypothetical protein